jgi:putative transposase
MSKRRTHSPEFKARVAMEAISGRKTIQEIAADHAIHPIQVSQWKKQLLEGASELFTRGKKSDVTPFVGPGLMRVGGCGHAAALC